MHNASLVAYGIAAALGAAMLSKSSGSKHVVLCFLLTFWILGAHIIQQPVFFLPLKALGGNVTMSQLFFVLLTAHVVWLWIVRFRLDRPLPFLPYEKFLYAFYVWLGCVLLYHVVSGALGGRELRAVVEGYVVVLVVYVGIKRFGDDELILTLGKAAVAVAAISSVLALIQCLGKSDFLLVGSARPAFADYVRGSGVYGDEYVHSYVVASALLIVLVFVRSRRLRLTLIPLFAAGILISFHRMSWVATGMLIILYFLHTKGKNTGRIVAIGVALLFVFILLLLQFTPIVSTIEASEAYQSRVSQDTMTGRFKIYAMVLDHFDDVAIWGVGTTSSALYFYGMLSIGGELEWARGIKGGTHNVYLDLLFMYGAPLLVLFMLLLGSTLYTWFRLLRMQSKVFLFPFGFALMYCVMNLTNGLPLNSTLGIVFGIVSGAGAYAATRERTVFQTRPSFV